MEHTVIDGITLEYELSGTGEPVVFIHGALIADSFRPLLFEPGLSDGYRLINYHRRGYVGSSRTSAPVSIARQAGDCRALLRHLGVERAHVVGHSFGGLVALQLALDAPEAVHTLALLEPALSAGTSAQAYRESLAAGEQRYRDAGAAAVVGEFLQVRWPDYRAVLDRRLPGAFDQAIADAGTAFEIELPEVRNWTFSEEDARSILQPVLSVLGGKSPALSPRFDEVHRLILAWLPRAEENVIPGASHFMTIQDPHAVAGALGDFFARNPRPA